MVQKARGRGRRGGRHGGGNHNSRKRRGPEPATSRPAKRANTDGRARAATTAASYMQAAMEILTEQAKMAAEGDEEEAEGGWDESSQHLEAALQCLRRVGQVDEGGEQQDSDGSHQANNTAHVPLPHGGAGRTCPNRAGNRSRGEEGYGSSSSSTARAIPVPPHHKQPYTERTAAQHQDKPPNTTEHRGPGEGTTTWEEVARLARQVGRGGGGYAGALRS